MISTIVIKKYSQSCLHSIRVIILSFIFIFGARDSFSFEVCSDPADLPACGNTVTLQAAANVTATGVSFTYTISGVTTLSQLLVTDLISGTTELYDLANGANQAITITNLNSGTSFSAKIHIECALGEKDSSPQGFTTLPQSPTLKPPGCPFDCTVPDVNSILFKWTPNGNATSFLLDVSANAFLDVNGFWNLQAPYVVRDNLTNTSKSQPGLLPGTNYHYQVRADLNGTSSAWISGSGPIPTKPSAPTALSVTGITANKYTAGWNTNNGNATDYEIQVSTTPGFGVVSKLSVPRNGVATSYTKEFTGLLPGTLYYYRVRALTPASEVFSAPIALITKPAIGSANNIKASSFDANWTSVSGATDYRLDVSPNDAFSSFVTDYEDAPAGAAKTTVDKNLTAGSVYYYRVRAKFNNGTLAALSPSSDASGIVITAPATSGVSDLSQNSFKLHWHAGTRIDGYQLDVSTNSLFSSFLPNYNGHPLGLGELEKTVNTNLSPGSVYYFRVRAVKGAAVSVNSVAAVAVTNPALEPASAVTSNSFVAEWDNSGTANGYRLDVSPDNTFNTRVTGYDDFPVNDGQALVGDLASASAYYYRIRAVFNSGEFSGVSGNPAPAETVLAVTSPVVTAATELASTSFIANWNEGSGVDGYELDVSESSTFDDFVYEKLQVTGTFHKVENLAPGHVYYYRVRAFKGTHVSPNSEQATTTVTAPLTTAAVSPLTRSFVAHWNAGSGVDKFRLDVSTSELFEENSILPFFNGFEIPGTASSYLVTGLEGGTTYHYRVRAEKAGVASLHSNSTSQLTLPLPPQSPDPNINAIRFGAGITSTTIPVTWNVSRSATEYEIEASLDDNFSSLVQGYPKTTSRKDYTAEGLQPSTLYRFRVRSRNATGYSETFSDFASQNTLDPNGTDPFTLDVITQPQFKTVFNESDDNHVISTEFKGGINNVFNVKFYHKKNSEENFTAESLIALPDGTHKVEVDKNWLDSFGMEFYFEARDASKTKLTNKGKIKNSAEVIVPVSSFGRAIKNYHIISFPYIIPNKTEIRALLTSVMGDYDNRKWRFYRYVNEDNQDFSEGAAAEQIEQGEAYWFISVDNKTLDFGVGESFGNSREEPFVLNLKKGWNIVGNPFPYDLSWQDVLDDGANVNVKNKVSDFYIFDGGKEPAGFAIENLLGAYSGGFVLANEAVKITIPVTLPEVVGGRSKKRNGDSSVEEIKGWYLPIELKQGEVGLSAGIGMSEGATDRKDNYDRVTPPRFIRFVEFNSRTESYDYALSRNIVDVRDTHEWNFEVESNATETVALEWNQQAANELGASLILFDRTNQKVVNMTLTDKYITTPSASISIYYELSLRNNGVALSELNKPYPNPFQTEVIIPFDYIYGERYPVKVEISDVAGRVVRQQELTPAGNLKQVTWDGRTNEGSEVRPGIYIYKICGNKSGLHNFCVNGKLIKK